MLKSSRVIVNLEPTSTQIKKSLGERKNRETRNITIFLRMLEYIEKELFSNVDDYRREQDFIM